MFTLFALFNRDAAYYELGHEVVHLLDPAHRSETLVLEEGMAVVSSLYIVDIYKVKPPSEIKPEYQEALDLVLELELGGGTIEGALVAGKLLRSRCGSFRYVTIDDLRKLFPDKDSTLFEGLCTKFYN